MMTSKINHELHYQHIKEPRKVHLAVRLQYYRGFIDDLRIYDIALNQWQIADIAEATP